MGEGEQGGGRERERGREGERKSEREIEREREQANPLPFEKDGLLRCGSSQASHLHYRSRSYRTSSQC